RSGCTAQFSRRALAGARGDEGARRRRRGDARASGALCARDRSRASARRRRGSAFRRRGVRARRALVRRRRCAHRRGARHARAPGRRAHQRVARQPARAGRGRAHVRAAGRSERTDRGACAGPQGRTGTGRAQLACTEEERSGLSMLLYLAQRLAEFESGFRVFGYLTLRAILAALTALAISFLVGPRMIRTLSHRQIGQQVRSDGPQSHLPKAGTPTMGGTLILVAIAAGTLLWADLGNRFVWITLLVTLAFGLIGFWDDYLKLIVGDSRGLIARYKYFWQSLAGLSAALALYFTAKSPAETALYVPFFKTVMIPLGGFYVVLTYFVVVGSSNAVNLTDGLDGLAIMPAVLVGGALGVFAYATGNAVFSDYLGIPFIEGTGELLVFCATLVGAGLGFLWFNTYPAQVFMGDIGALAIGAALGVVAVIV